MRSKRSVCQISLIAFAALIAGCAGMVEAPREAVPVLVAPGIVYAPANDPTSPAWRDVPIRFKTPTRYSRAEIGGVPCILAEANASWSLHVTDVPMQFASASKLSWRWHVPAFVKDADNESPGSDDAPARLVIAFKGDKTKLDAADRSTMALAKALGGNELPFAAIQYIWEEDASIEKIIPNANISRVKKIVVRSGATGLAQWQSIERNVREDYRRAFPGEEAGEIESIGLMTDTDALGGIGKACYADIELK